MSHEATAAAAGNAAAAAAAAVLHRGNAAALCGDHGAGEGSALVIFHGLKRHMQWLCVLQGDSWIVDHDLFRNILL